MNANVSNDINKASNQRFSLKLTIKVGIETKRRNWVLAQVRIAPVTQPTVGTNAGYWHR